MRTKQISKDAFALRGEMIAQDPMGMIPLLESDDCIGLVNAMCQCMADAGCRAGEIKERTHKCLSNMEIHKISECPSLIGFK